MKEDRRGGKNYSTSELTTYEVLKLLTKKRKEHTSTEVNNFITSKEINNHCLSDTRIRTKQTRSVVNKFKKK